MGKNEESPLLTFFKFDLGKLPRVSKSCPSLVGFDIFIGCFEKENIFRCLQNSKRKLNIKLLLMQLWKLSIPNAHVNIRHHIAKSLKTDPIISFSVYIETPQTPLLTEYIACKSETPAHTSTSAKSLFFF